MVGSFFSSYNILSSSFVRDFYWQEKVYSTLGKQKALGLPGMMGSGLKAAKGPSPSAKGKYWSHAAGTGSVSIAVSEERQMAGQISDIFGNGGSITLTLRIMEKIKKTGLPSARRRQAQTEGSRPRVQYF